MVYENNERSKSEVKTILDIFIIGGGINGTAIASDAAGRGLAVTLVEKNDLASGTSSASSKLIHGGLRYLEFYEFGLVRKALLEREVLLFRAPHLVTPLEFILPHESHLRPAWMIRVGLFLYDHLAKRKRLPGSKSVNLHNSIYGKSLLEHLKKGFSYYDCFADDSRLVIENAISAKLHGANILTRTEFMSAIRENNHWKIQLKNTRTQEIFYCYSKALLNVGGPWIKEIQRKIKDTNMQFDIKLDKGSHIIVPKIYEGDHAYILQNKDQRVIFAIPYRNKFTLVGTTDIEYAGNLDDIRISPLEEEYLCKSINDYFTKSISPSDIRWSYAGVRCLQASTGHTAATASRDFKYLHEIKNNSLLFVVIGGKLTTHRTLAEDALDHMKEFFPEMKGAWTKTKALPGGDIPHQDFQAFYKNFHKKYPWLPKTLAHRYVKSYGSRANLLLQNKHSIADLGIDFGSELYQNEVEYLIAEEWAETSDDILWRRSKLGLNMSKKNKKNLDTWLNEMKQTVQHNIKKCGS